jgi:exonuclease V gamma subunit
MGISLNISNSLSPLSTKLASDLKAISVDPFSAQWVVTQTEGMNSWLKTALARELGIASNIRFCKPNDIVSRVHQLCTYRNFAVVSLLTARQRQLPGSTS